MHINGRDVHDKFIRSVGDVIHRVGRGYRCTSGVRCDHLTADVTVSLSHRNVTI